ERLARLEAGRLAGRDLDLLAGAGLDAGASLAVADLEGTEARHRDGLALGELRLDAVEHGIHGGAGLLLAEAGRAGDVVDQFRLVHKALRQEHMHKRAVLYAIGAANTAPEQHLAPHPAGLGPKKACQERD